MGKEMNLTKALDVVVIGTPAVDMLARVEVMPHTDGLAVAKTYARYPGGAGANVAVGIARLGKKVGFIGRLGDDDGGQMLMRDFEIEGVDTRGIRISPDEDTPACFIAVDQEGNRMIFALGGVILSEEIDKNQLSVLDGIRGLFITDVPHEIAVTAIEECRKHSSTVFLNPGGLLLDEGLDVLTPLISMVDVLIISRSEMARLMGKVDPASAARVISRIGPEVVLITLGAEGALILEDNTVSRIEPFEAPKIVDTTGAGDAFTAGLMAARLESLDWQVAAKIGAAVAAIKIGHEGARGGLPTRHQVDEFIKQRSRGDL